MKRKDIKKAIVAAYKSETPDLRSKILESCKSEAQEADSDSNETYIERTKEKVLRFSFSIPRTVAAAACLMVFALGAVLGLLALNDGGPVETPIAETFVYIDVNPGVELQMDAQKNVIGCLPTSEDAVELLADLQLDGLDLNTAIRAVVGAMYMNGYISESSNSILITVASANESTADALLLDISEKIKSVFSSSNVECAIIAQCVIVDEELEQRAEQYGVSLGKMQLLRKISIGLGGLTAEEMEVLTDLSIKDLNMIYSENCSNSSQYGHEFILGEVYVSLSKSEAVVKILEHLGKAEEDLASSHCIFRLSRYDKSKVVYAVTLKLHDDSTVYRYEVDCHSGELLKIENKTKK